MTSQDFQIKIQSELDPRFSILPNPNRPGLNNIFFEGKNYDLPVIGDEVKEEIDPRYRYEFPGGSSARMWSIPEVMDKLKGFISQVNKKDFKELYEEK